MMFFMAWGLGTPISIIYIISISILYMYLSLYIYNYTIYLYICMHSYTNIYICPAWFGVFRDSQIPELPRDPAAPPESSASAWRKWRLLQDGDLVPGSRRAMACGIVGGSDAGAALNGGPLHQHPSAVVGLVFC